jgi:hypothetical protein
MAIIASGTATISQPAERLTFARANTNDAPFSMVLTQRALPLDTLEVGGKMRTEFTWYAGSPVATVQVLGAEENDISLRGFWKERFIGSGSVAQILVDNMRVYSVEAAVAAMDGARRRGQPLVMTWGNICRTVFIKEFQQTWYNFRDCEWSLVLGVVTIDTIVPTVPTPQAPDLSAINAKTQQALYNLVQIINDKPAQLRWDSRILAALAQLDDTLLDVQGQIFGAVTDFVGQALTPFDAARRLGALLQTTLGALNAFGNQIMGLSLSDLFEGFADPADIPIEVQQIAAFKQSQVYTQTRDTRNTYLESILPQIQSLSPPLVATFIASNEQDLRDVSLQFYGSQNYWRGLMAYNNLKSSKLVAGDLIWVPQNFSDTSNAFGDR